MPRDETQVRHTVSFNAELDRRMAERIERGGFSSVSEYLRQAVRDELKRADRERLDAELLARLDDEAYEPVTREELSELRRRVGSARQAAKRPR